VSSPLKFVFKNGGTYSRLNDDEVKCSGNYEIQDNSISFYPIDCSFPPDIDITETIYKLTADTLIISRTPGYSSSPIRDKYLRIN
jgi:hypothetical protein